MNNKRLTITLVSTVIALLVNMGISFFLTPYVIKNVSSEAYGFVSLANNFTGYAQILTVALNSMAGRFIAIAYHKGNKREAEEYLSSTFYANVLICVILLIPVTIFIARLEHCIHINEGIVFDVKLLFACIAISFFVTLINTPFATATFLANRKELEAKRNIESYIIKAIILVVLFAFLVPHIFYVGIATIFTTLYVFAANLHYKKKLLPELDISKKYFSIKKVKTLILSGVWNSFNRLSSVLSEGLDLLITNMFISSASMGTLAIAKMVPGVISTMIGQCSGIFAPNFTIAYAENDFKKLYKRIRQSILIMGLISNLCLIVLSVIGEDFFRLWVPSEDSKELQLLSLLTIGGMAINGGVQCIFNIYTVTNRIRANALVSLASNMLNIVIVFVLLRNTDLGIYAVAGVSTVITILRNLSFSIPYAAKCINCKSRIFFVPVFTNLIALFVCIGTGFFIKGFFVLRAWPNLFCFAIVIGVVSVVINTLIITNKEEKKKIFERMKNMFKVS